MFKFLKPDRPNWRHYFGSLGLLMLVLQLLTGIILTMFYEPTLTGAYKSVQYLTNQVTGGSLSRNLHRWIALSLFAATIVHTVRSTLRKDFMNITKRVDWLTGVLFLWPLFLLLYTGLVLPWEWKGYWFMEMIATYSATLPVIGQGLKTFFVWSFTLPRYLVIHILILPVICLVLADYHFLTRLRKRGIFRHMARHLLISMPFIIALVALSIYVTIPSLDPDEIPLPLEGAFIPEPEWIALTLLLPFKYFKGVIVPILSVYGPFALLSITAFMPYYLGRMPQKSEAGQSDVKKGFSRVVPLILRGTIVFVITAVFLGLIYLGSFRSPTLGCNSCHNLSRGVRMGVPPEYFKERHKLPNLEDDMWMMGHWYYPNEVF